MSKTPKDIRERAFEFALRIIKLCQHLDRKPEKSVAEPRDEADELKRILGSIVVRTKRRTV